MNTGDLIARANYLVAQGNYKDVSTSFDPLPALNRAQIEFSSETECNEEEYTFTTVANQSEYTLTTPSWINIKSVFYNGVGPPLDFMNPIDMDNNNPNWVIDGVGTPYIYLLPKSGVIKLYKKPDTSSVNVLIRGTRNLPALALVGDIPAFKEQYHEALAYRAAWDYIFPFTRGDDQVIADKYLAKYNSYVAKCKASVTGDRYSGIQRTQRRSRPRIPMAGGYPSGTW